MSGPQDLEVAWADGFAAESAGSSLESYGDDFHRDVVVECDPGSMVDSYQLSVSISGGSTPVDGGYRATQSGSGEVDTPTLNLGATSEQPAPPSSADVSPISDVADRPLQDIPVEGAEEGEAEVDVDRPGEPVDRYVGLVASLSDDFERLSRSGDSERAFFDVDGTSVELTVEASRFHGDHGWRGTYYVDERVVRGADDADADPTDGEPRECGESTRV